MRSIKLFALLAIAVLSIGLFSHTVTAQTEDAADLKSVMGGDLSELITAAAYLMSLRGTEDQVVLSANASISGRVMTSNGSGISNAVVVLSGGTLTQPVFIQTGPFGSYSFQNLQVGQTYFLQVSAKRFRFASPSRLITLQDNLDDMNFIANPQD